MHKAKKKSSKNSKISYAGFRRCYETLNREIVNSLFSFIFFTVGPGRNFITKINDLIYMFQMVVKLVRHASWLLSIYLCWQKYSKKQSDGSLYYSEHRSADVTANWNPFGIHESIAKRTEISKTSFIYFSRKSSERYCCLWKHFLALLAAIFSIKETHAPVVTLTGEPFMNLWTTLNNSEKIGKAIERH